MDVFFHSEEPAGTERERRWRTDAGQVVILGTVLLVIIFLSFTNISFQVFIFCTLLTPRRNQISEEIYTGTIEFKEEKTDVWIVCFCDTDLYKNK